MSALSINQSNENMKSGQLKSLALVKISGPDAPTFLQGQLTNDIEALEQSWQFNGYCNPKGRLIALLQLWRDDDGHFFAVLPKDLCDTVIKRLRMYVLRSKVVINESEQHKLYGFASKDDLIKTIPEFAPIVESHTKNQVIHGNNASALIINQHVMLISRETSKAIKEASFDEQWMQFNIEQGLPHISLASSELFIPQMVNLDLLDGINFKKGCYTGQEIVARMHYLGKLKQRMFACSVSGEIGIIQTGDKIMLASNNTAGHIVLANNDSTQCLAVLKLDSSDETLYLENGGTIKKLENQPYKLS